MSQHLGPVQVWRIEIRIGLKFFQSWDWVSILGLNFNLGIEKDDFGLKFFNPDWNLGLGLKSLNPDWNFQSGLKISNQDWKVPFRIEISILDWKGSNWIETGLKRFQSYFNPWIQIIYFFGLLTFWRRGSWWKTKICS